MKKIKGENGVTLIALIVTIVLMLILASVSIINGTDLVEKARMETVETNLLTIKAKAKEYAENVDSLTWIEDDTDAGSNGEDFSTKEIKNREEFQNTYYLTLIEDETSYGNYSSWYQDDYTYYAVSQEALTEMGLDDLWEDGVQYIIRYPLEDGDTDDLEIDIIYIEGIEYQDTTYYELSEMQEVL